MWIRSQDRTCLVDAKRIIVIRKQVVNQVSNQECDDYDLLGEYPSEKRAIEVLDDIQDYIQKYEYTRGGSDAQFYVVYEMPQE